HKVGGGVANPEFARLAIRASRAAPDWMSAHGVRWQPPLTGTLQLGRTNRFFLGGGKALVNAYYDTAARMGIDVRYEACVVDIIVEDGRVQAVVVRNGDSQEHVRGRAVAVAAGGFGGSRGRRARRWVAAA